MKDILVQVIDEITRVGADYAEVRTQKNENTLLEMKDGQMEAVTVANEVGAGIRVLANGAWGFSTTNSLLRNEIAESLKAALKMASTAGKQVREPVKLADAKAVEDKVRVSVKKDPRDIDVSTKISNLLEINKRCYDFDTRIRSVTLNSANLITEQTLANSDGTFVEQEKMIVWNYCWVTGKRGAVIASARDEIGAHGYELYDEHPPSKIAERVCKKVIQQLEAEPAKSGSHIAIIGTDIVGVLAHEALGHICEADLALSGSAVMGKLGEQIASEEVTIYDSALIPEGFGALKYDDEGVPGEKTILIREGVLVSYLHNRETAGKTGVSPTGNARAQDFRVPPIIRMRNTCFQEGSYSFTELLDGVKSGYYLEDFRGGQANLDGTFTVGVQSAFRINKGELSQPVRNLGISGNTLETLRQVDACGRDSSLETGRCGKGQLMFCSSGGPPLRVKTILIGGA